MCSGTVRSAEARAFDEPNQDYLAFRAEGERLVFAVCDGVGSSFRGDIAAQIVGETLLDWLWAVEDADEATRLWPQAIDEMASRARRFAETEISADLPEVLRDVLAEKQERGSESMFASGVLDLHSGRHVLVWAGDVRISVTERGASPAFDATAFSTANRWSSKHGLIGEVAVREFRWNPPWRLDIYTDGLASEPPPASGQIRNWFERSTTRPDADDCSFLSVAWDKDDQAPLTGHPLSGA
ncbi:MAG: protein phosphatase 2C domain-containing protein [Thermomicrobiales bacterium]|nr:protein phosphatase 2C domain-containing protein [Thermomicrobiales bacterium]